MSNTKRQNRVVTIILWLLCLLYVLQITNRTLNYHSHIIKGKVISHAHPFNKKTDSSPFKNHHHSASEFVLIETIEFLFLLVFAFISVYVAGKKYLSVKRQFNQYCSGYLIQRLGRAPPMLPRLIYISQVRALFQK